MKQIAEDCDDLVMSLGRLKRTVVLLNVGFAPKGAFFATPDYISAATNFRTSKTHLRQNAVQKSIIVGVLLCLPRPLVQSFLGNAGFLKN